MAGLVDAWRVTRSRYALAAFDGEGAWRYGGRWNERGIRIAYASSTLSLAVLEVLAQVLGPEDLRDYVAVRARIPEGGVDELAGGDLPRDWRRVPPPKSTRSLGSRWAEGAGGLALRVPSAVLPEEHNLLINPAHPRFEAITIDDPRPLDLDPQLLRVSGSQE
jgi:RES domain-containing protein